MEQHGINIPERFKELLSDSQGKLEAFIWLYRELKEKDPEFPLNDSNLQGVLTGFGIDVSYISSCYKLYTHWQKQGVDLARSYDQLIIQKIPSLKRRVDLLTEQIAPLGLPSEKLKQSLRFYVYQILEGFGYIQKKDRKTILLEKVDYGLATPETGTGSLLEALYQRGIVLQNEEIDVAVLLSQGYAIEEIAEEMEISVDQATRIKDTLAKKLQAGWRSDLPPYTGAGDTSIHKAMDHMRKLREEGQMREAQKLLTNLKSDLAVAMATQDIEPLMVKYNEQFGDGLEVDLMLDDIPEVLESVDESLGGIDFRSETMNIRYEGEAPELTAPMTPQEIENMPIDGFVPMIIHVTPITNLPLFLGAAGTSREGEKPLASHEPHSSPDRETRPLLYAEASKERRWSRPK